MPDWISHILLALIICEIFNIRKKSLVILGSLLPDVLFKIQLIGNIIDIPQYEIYWLLAPLHTPIGCLLATFLIIFLFKYPKKKTFLLVTFGWISHLLIDMVTKFLFLGQTIL